MAPEIGGSPWQELEQGKFGQGKFPPCKVAQSRGRKGRAGKLPEVFLDFKPIPSLIQAASCIRQEVSEEAGEAVSLRIVKSRADKPMGKDSQRAHSAEAKSNRLGGLVPRALGLQITMMEDGHLHFCRAPQPCHGRAEAEGQSLPRRDEQRRASSPGRVRTKDTFALGARLAVRQ